jgi:hypothetical protein
VQVLQAQDLPSLHVQRLTRKSPAVRLGLASGCFCARTFLPVVLEVFFYSRGADKSGFLRIITFFLARLVAMWEMRRLQTRVVWREIVVWKKGRIWNFLLTLLLRAPGRPWMDVPEPNEVVIPVFLWCVPPP